MERKTKQRILGILVVIGIIAILLPFFQTNKQLPSEKMLVKAPPFPDQMNQSAQLTQDAVTPDEVQSTDMQTRPVATLAPDEASRNPQPDDTIANPPKPLEKTALNNTQPIMQQPVILAQNNSQPVIDQPAQDKAIATKPIENNGKSADSNTSDTVTQTNTSNSSSQKVAPDLSPDNSSTDDDEDETQIVDKQTHNKGANKKINVSQHQMKSMASKASPSKKETLFVPKVIEYKTLVSAVKSTPLTGDGLSRLKNSAWVIQLGSFKDKTHAVRLVNQLRAKGYRAFIQQISTTVGSTTRVFVGPEVKQEHARAMANNIANSMQIHGIVISYKPLTL